MAGWMRIGMNCEMVLVPRTDCKLPNIVLIFYKDGFIIGCVKNLINVVGKVYRGEIRANRKLTN